MNAIIHLQCTHKRIFQISTCTLQCTDRVKTVAPSTSQRRRIDERGTVRRHNRVSTED